VSRFDAVIGAIRTELDVLEDQNQQDAADLQRLRERLQASEAKPEVQKKLELAEGLLAQRDKLLLSLKIEIKTVRATLAQANIDAAELRRQRDKLAVRVEELRKNPLQAIAAPLPPPGMN
jgi:chromosome segregation ATPase